MTPNEFYHTYIPFARESEIATGVPALFTLAQAALESGWGKKVKGNNFFGIKDTDGVNGNEIEFWTTEYNKRLGKWFKIKQYFRKYKTPADSFTDHGKFLRRYDRYREAFKYSNSPIQFAFAIAKAGYATDPKYGTKVVQIMNMFPKP